MLSVVVLAADVVRIMSVPSECDPILLVDANTVLPLPVTSQRLQAIAGNGRPVVETLRSVKHRQLPMRGGPEVAGHPRAALLFRSSHRSAVAASANDWIMTHRYTDTVYP